MSNEPSKNSSGFVWLLLAGALVAFLCMGGLIGLGGLVFYLRLESRPAPPPVIVTPDAPQTVPAPPPPAEPPRPN